MVKGKKRGRGRPKISGAYICFKCPDELYEYVRGYGLNALQDDNWSAAIRRIIEDHRLKVASLVDLPSCHYPEKI